MPINQPTVVDHVQRPFNQVNLTGAIANAFAVPFGEALGQGVKDLMGISTASEDYTRSMTGVNQGVMASRADAAWQNILANPGSEGLASNLDYKRQVGVSQGLQGDALEAWVNTSLGDTPVTGGLRNIGAATRKQQSLDEMPGQGASSPQGQPSPSATNTPAGVPQTSASPPMPEPPRPAAVDAAQQISQDIRQAQVASEAEIRPDTLPKAAAEVSTPPSVPGGLPGTAPDEATRSSPQQLPPLDKDKLRQQLQAYTIRQGSYLAMYRQMANAALTGKMDNQQLALVTSLSNMRQAELTQMMQTVAPSIGLDMVDKDNKPITGQALEWGAAYAQIERMSPDALKDFMAKHPEAYKTMRGAATQYQQLLGNMSLIQAARLRQVVDTVVDKNLVSPEAAYTGWHNEQRLRQQAEQFDKTLALDEKKFSVAAQQTLLQMEGMKINNRMHEQQLEIISKYGPQEAALAIQKAQAELQANNVKLGIFQKQADRDELATIIGTWEKGVELEEKSNQVFYQQQEKQAARYQNAVLKYNQQIATENDRVKDLAPIWSNAYRALYEKTRPAAVDAWLQSNPSAMAETGGAQDYHTKFQVYFANQPGRQDYKEHYLERTRLEKQRDVAQAQLDDALSVQAPKAKDGIRQLAGAEAKQAIQRRIQEGSRLRAKTKIREAGEAALDADSSLVNDLVADYGDPNGNGSYRPVGVWSEWESKALLHLVQGSPSKLKASQLEGVPVAGKKLKDALGNRWGDFYSAYVRLYGELK